MIINIQYTAAERLLRDLLEAVPAERQPEFAARVDTIASELSHPNLDGTVVFGFGRNGALESSSTL